MNNELARRAKKYATERGQTFTELVEEAVSDLLTRNPRREAPKKIVLPTSGKSSRRMTEEEYEALVERLQLEDDLKSIWGSDRAPSRR